MPSYRSRLTRELFRRADALLPQLFADALRTVPVHWCKGCKLLELSKARTVLQYLVSIYELIFIYDVLTLYWTTSHSPLGCVGPVTLAVPHKPIGHDYSK